MKENQNQIKYHRPLDWKLLSYIFIECFFLLYFHIYNFSLIFTYETYGDSKERNTVRDTNDWVRTYSMNDKVFYYSIVASCPKVDQDYNYKD